MFHFYSCSEFFHKGPRPRSKRDDKSLEGADRIDGMVAETELGSYNHAPHGAPIVKSEIDSLSVISADRTPPLSVRAPACNWHASTRVRQQSPTSLNDDSPEFVAHYSVIHDPDQLTRDSSSLEELHAPSYFIRNKQNLPDTECCAINHDNTSRKQTINDVDVSYKSESADRQHKIDDVNNVNTTDYITIKSPNVFYSIVDKTGNFQSSLTAVNPVTKPDRVDENATKNTEVQPESKWAKTYSAVNLLKRVLAGSEKPNVSSDVLREKSKSQTKYTYLEAADRQENTASANSDVELTSQDVVYMNREASDTELDVKSKEQSNSLQEILKTYFDKTLNSAFNSEEKLRLSPTETDTLLAENCKDDHTKHAYYEGEDVFEEKEKEPLILNVHKKKNCRVPPLFTFKSHSLEQTEKQHQDLCYDSDDSVGKAYSLRSQSSMRSRLSRLSNLSCALGPVVRIDPDESVRVNHGVHSLSLPMRPRIRQNVGYVAFSSFDTETSEAPSSSVSCDSLSPRSLPSETQSDHSPGDQDRKKNRENRSDKSSRNVAIGSLRYTHHKRKPDCNLYLDLDMDSGVGSLPKNINGTHAMYKIPVENRIFGNSVPEVNTIKPSGKRNFKQKNGTEMFDNVEFINEQVKIEPQETAQQPAVNGHVKAKTGQQSAVNGHVKAENGEHVSENLLTPFHFLNMNAKRGILRKQAGSEIDEYD